MKNVNKICSLCGEEKPISAYYKSKGYAGGYTRRCKECTRKKSRERELKLRSTIDGLIKDRERHRIKAKKYNHADRYKPSKENRRESILKYNEKYPEKKEARNRSSHLRPLKKGNHLHHWSYNYEHHKDVIELTKKDHVNIHRFLSYDNEEKMYRCLISNELLDTREKHELKIKEILKSLTNE